LTTVKRYLCGNMGGKILENPFAKNVRE